MNAELCTGNNKQGEWKKWKFFGLTGNLTAALIAKL